MSDSVVYEWCRKFKDGRTDEGGQRHKSLATVNIAQRVENEHGEDFLKSIVAVQYDSSNETLKIRTNL